MKTFIFFSSIIFYQTLSISAKPNTGNNHITPCHAKDSNINECIKTVSQEMFKLSTNGYKHLGIQKMDPLFIPGMSLHNGEGPVSLNLDLINATHRGFSKAHVVSVNSDPAKYTFQLNTTLPEYNIKGLYNVSGKVIMLPIMGTGPSEISFTDLTTSWTFKGEPYEKNHKKYMKITDFKFEMETKGMHTKLENLFNGNKQLGDTMNRFLNENWEEVFKQLKSGIEESFSLMLLSLGNRALSNVEYTKMFPDLA